MARGLLLGSGVFRLLFLPVLACVAACASGDVMSSGPDAGGGKTDDPRGGGGADCPGIPCDLVSQCGCRESEACDLAAGARTAEDTACRPAGEGTAESTCESSNDCASGFICQEGQCWRWCESDDDCGGGHCLPAFGDVVGARTCSKACEPGAATASGCPDGFACRYYLYDPNDSASPDGDEFEYADCSPAGDGAYGIDCTEGGDAACAAGYGCYDISWDDGSTTVECRQICVVAVGGSPADNKCNIGTCQAWTDPAAVIGNVEYGICY